MIFLEEIAADNREDNLSNVAQMILDNKFVMSKLNQEGSVFFVDPAMVDMTARERVLRERVANPGKNVNIGGMYNNSTQNIYINPESRETRVNAIHEIFENILSNVFASEYTDHPARLNFRNEIDTIYDYVSEIARQNNITTNDHYGLTSPSEMVMEAWANPKFQAFLKQIPSQNKPQSVWRDLIDSIRNLLSKLLKILKNLKDKAP